MDLQLFARVCWRFRVIVAAGVLLAITLALASYVTIGSHGLKYRQQQQWVSYSTMFLTQKGDPSVRTDADNPVTPLNPDGTVKVSPGGSTPEFGSSSRFAYLATLYAQWARSDLILNLLRKQGPVDGDIHAVPVLSLDTQGDPLPLVQVAGLAPTAAGSASLAHRATQAFKIFLITNQQQNAVPADRRVVVQVIDAPSKAVIWKGRKLTRPILVFLTLMTAVIGFIFVLENMRPRIRKIEGAPVDEEVDKEDAA